MNEDTKYSAKKQVQIAKYALFCGPSKACSKFNLDKDTVLRWMFSVIQDEPLLLQRAKELVIDAAFHKGIQPTANIFELDKKWVEQLVVPELDEKITLQDLPVFVEDKTTLTTPQMFKSFSEISVQAEDSEPRKLRKLEHKHSTAEKIEAVRNFVKYSNQTQAAKDLNIPVASLIRWRDKVRNQLFQEEHSRLVYQNKKPGRSNKFFQEVDNTLFEWISESKDKLKNIDQEIIKKAKSLAKLDENEPLVSPSWLEGFKSNYKIVQQ